MSSANGEGPVAPLELREVLSVRTESGEERSYEVVAILEDPDSSASYAVLERTDEGKREPEEGEFIVTSPDGQLLDDDELAQEILDDFRVFVEEAEDGGESG
jgi:uncharacterized protein YrzB (UPF0473 family)